MIGMPTCQRCAVSLVEAHNSQSLEHGHIISRIGIFRPWSFPIGIMRPSELSNQDIEERREELSFSRR
jgi:hypothetical protein